MLIGVPREIKPREERVGLTPASVLELVRAGHQVIVETHAGAGIGARDEDYMQVGARIVSRAAQIYAQAELIVKVKEPQAIECEQLKANQILFAYLHLAPDPKQAHLLLKSGVSAVAYETVTQNEGGLPLLIPMSQVAGRLSIQAGAHCLERTGGGRGILLGGVPGVASANVVVIGGGIVGTNAIRMAMGLEAHVTVLDKSLTRLRELDFQFGSKLNTIYATADAIERYVTDADLVIGAVLVPGGHAPRVITREHIKKMRRGSVIVDVAIDQGGCVETSHPTTHDNPTYIEEGVVHYCVVNMPGAVPHTSTYALNNATLPFVLALANKGLRKAMSEDVHLCRGLNIHDGNVTHDAVAAALNLPYVEPHLALAI